MKKIVFYVVFAIVSVWLAYYLNDRATEWYYNTPNPIIGAVRTVRGVLIPPKIVNKIKSRIVRSDGKISPKIPNDEEEIEACLVNRFHNDVHLDIGVYNSFVPLSSKYLSPKVSVGLSLFSYGNEYRDRWRFVRIGVGGMVNSGVDVTISPAMYNVGNKIPILSNTYVHPYIGYNVTNGVPILGLQLSLSF